MRIIGVERINKMANVKFTKDVVGKNDLQLVVVAVLVFDIERIYRMATHRKTQAQHNQQGQNDSL